MVDKDGLSMSKEKIETVLNFSKNLTLLRSFLGLANYFVPMHSTLVKPMQDCATSNYAIFDTLNVDYIGLFPDKGYILVIIDTFTRWAELFWCADAVAKSAADCLLAHFDRFGSPNMIRSDRGSQN